MKIYSILDSKSGLYSPPMFLVSAGLALRMFADEANNPQSTICRHPDDFQLFELGDFNEGNASFDLLDAPHLLGVATEYKSAA